MKRATLLFISLVIPRLFIAQTSGVMVGWQTEPPAFIYLYEELEALSGAKILVDVLAVGADGQFIIPSNYKNSRVVEFESPPWSWKVILAPSASDTLLLHKPLQGPTKLFGVSAKSTYSSGSSHPSAIYLDFLNFTSDLDYLAMYDRMVLSGAVGDASGLVNQQYLDSLDHAFHERYFNILDQITALSSIFYIDLVNARRWQWRSESGWSQTELKEAWHSEVTLIDSRSWEYKITSPGWMRAWATVHGHWYSSKEESSLHTWVSNGSIDSIATHLLCSVEEASIAMWWWDLSSPSQITSGWWARFEETPVGNLRAQSLSSDLQFSTDSFLNARWTTPSNDIISVDELYGKWTVMLTIKYASTTSLREWGALRAISETMNLTREDIRFIVLSIDGTEDLWQGVLNKRKSTSEIVRWVGADARWMYGLDLHSVPTTTIITPGLEIYEFAAPAPSCGLRKYLENLPE